MMRGLPAFTVLAFAAVLYAQSPVYDPGDLVQVQDMASPPVLRVVAIPGDQVQSDDSGIYINGQPVSDFTPEFLARARWRNQIIPDGHYLLMGEQRVNADISEHVGLHPAIAVHRVPE